MALNLGSNSNSSDFRISASNVEGWVMAWKSCTFSPPSEGNAGYGKWTRATIIRKYHEPKPESLFKQERRNAGARNPKKVQGMTAHDNEPRREDMKEEHAPHLDTRNNGQNLDSRLIDSDTDQQISPHMGDIFSRGLLRTPHLLNGVPPPPPNSNTDQILLLTNLFSARIKCHL
ncbi:hypothetical protein Pyn_39636 [Prunus yedoensis var. nudiflora]|uniref:Uncharacterized protein n=1 Tax=Prunus yedoensis var. nudiflora TaxID=2094558 RepID=A0A314YVQ4_PRUYE|nr:hypothetical protein Pyn_39636 [Prunus yedoensis var. nudiflora]